MTHRDRINQKGVSLIAAIFIIVVLAFMGLMLVSIQNTATLTSVNDVRSSQAVYVPDGGLESAVLSLTTPSLGQRLACSDITGDENLTEKTLGSGQFTVTADSPYYPANATTLSGSISSSTTTITVGSTAGYAPSGRIMIDRELIDYSGISGNSFTGAARGQGGSSAASHASNAPVGQNQCGLTAVGGVPDLTAPVAKRTVTAGVQTQEGWIAGSGNFTDANLRGIDCTSTSNCWAVGDGGTILHYTGGSTWDTVASPTTNNLRSVAMLSSSSGWAVGDNGTIIHWDGSTWSTQSSGTTENLNAVTIGNSSNVYAVGNAGKIQKWNGSSWSSQTSNTTYNLNGISAFDSSHVLAVGDLAGGTKPTMVATTNGSSWGNYTSDAPATGQNLNAVMIYNASSLLGLGLGGCTDYGVAVGDGGSAMRAGGGLNVLGLLVLGGSGWTSTGSGQAQNLNGVAFFQRCCGLLCLGCCQDGWTVGDGGVIRRWNGSGWSSFSSPTSQNLNAVYIYPTNQSYGWAVGDGGTILKWNGSAWSVWSQLSGKTFRWTGSSWSDAASLMPANVKNLNSLSMLSYADGWAVGEAASTTSDSGWTILRWNNPTANTWNQIAVTTAARAANLNSIFMVSSQDGFAVGNTNSDSGGSCTGSRARILRWNGSAWSCVASTTSYALNSVSMIDADNNGSADDGWAVGTRSGTGSSNWNLVRWNGTGWNTVTNTVTPSTSAQNLYAVSMISATDGWAVGNASGTATTNWRILRWNSPTGSAWNLTSSVTPATGAKTLYSVYMLSSSDGWAVGDGGMILRWNAPTANQWNVISSPTANALNSVFCARAVECWASGDSGTMLHWDGSSWSVIQNGLTSATLKQVHVIGPGQQPLSQWREVVN